MSKWTGILTVLLLAMLVLIVARPQYLQWRAERYARQAQDERIATKVAAVRECRNITKEFEAWRAGNPIQNSMTKSEKDAEGRVWDCIWANHVDRGEVAHLTRF